ncbi:MAG: hypothetical protein ABIJ61_12360 [bacterium]
MRKALTLLVAAALLTAGCIVTGNIVILIDVGDFGISPSGLFGYEYVDLTQNSDYNDHKEDLNSIDDVGFVCKIQNTGSSSATGKLYIATGGSSSSSPTAIPTNKILVLDGITVAAGQTRTITLEESYDYLKNFEDARDAILDEKFTVYWEVPNPYDVQVMDMVVVLSINGKP